MLLLPNLAWLLLLYNFVVVLLWFLEQLVQRALMLSWTTRWMKVRVMAMDSDGVGQEWRCHLHWLLEPTVTTVRWYGYFLTMGGLIDTEQGSSRYWHSVEMEIKGMRKCTGNNTQKWGFDAIFDVKCPTCGNMVEFFKDEIIWNCSHCKNIVYNDRKDYGCVQWCSCSSSHMRNFCPKFKRSKDRFYGHKIA